MRLFLSTFVPMLAAAILVTAAGERLSRREHIERTPHDRERLLDFSAALHQEVQRLEALYLARLDHIARTAIESPDPIIETTAEKTIGVSLLKVYRLPKKDNTYRIANRLPDEPEIVMTKRDRPFDPNKVVTLTTEVFNTKGTSNGTWLTTHNPRFRIHHRSPATDQVVAFLIDFQVVTTAFHNELQSWMATPALPLIEADERVAVRFQEHNLLTSQNKSQGPAAAIIPFRTLFGDLEIRAWDGLQTSSYRDPSTVIVTAALALFLLTSGILLYWHQRRALRLAGERVSFVNRVSHELGSPLTNLALNIDLANDSLPSNPTQARKRLTIVTEEIERLSRLVANVLTFSRQEKNTLELHPEQTLVHQIVAEVIDNFRPSFARKGIAVKTQIASTSPSLLDPDALRQIIGNLLSNIEKYASTGKTSQVTLYVKEEQFIVEVSDQGPGIPNKERERIFLPFERVHRTTSEGSSGTGLGLAIARDLANRMNGSLELLDCKTGCTFRLTLHVKPTLTVVADDSSAA